jgi:hypothetical protein
MPRRERFIHVQDVGVGSARRSSIAPCFYIPMLCYTDQGFYGKPPSMCAKGRTKMP